MTRALLSALADRVRLAGVAAAALALGAGAAFAAAPPPTSAGQVTIQTVSGSTVTPTAGAVPATTAQPSESAADVETLPVDAVPEQLADCPEAVRNHGQYVSSVARSVTPGPRHGELVSAAARGDCGKAPKPSGSGPDAKTPKHEKAERPVRGHEREGHPGRGPARP